MSLLIGKDSSNNKLREIELDTSGHLLVSPLVVSSNALPTGAATESSLSSIDGKVTACDTGSVTVFSSALPSGAASESSLSSLDGKVTACDTGAVVVSSSALPSGAASESSLSSLDGKVTACDTGSVTVFDCALPSGAATELSVSSSASSLSTLAGTVSAGRVLISGSMGAAVNSVVSATVMNAVSISGGATAFSTAVDLHSLTSPNVTVFGNIGSGSATVELDLQVSSDNSNFYNLTNTFVSLDMGSGDLGIHVPVSARYIRLRVINTNLGSSTTATVIISGV